MSLFDHIVKNIVIKHYYNSVGHDLESYFAWPKIGISNGLKKN